MKLIEAFEVLKRGREAPDAPLPVLLACGFEPVHLATFVAAHLQQRFPRRPIDLRRGLYGDLAGTLERGDRDSEAAAVVIEWGDLDPRLGVRGVGGWSPSALGDVQTTARRAATRLRAAIGDLAASHVIALCPPTLPLPPLAFTPAAQASSVELELQAIVDDLTAWAVGHPRVRVARRQRLDVLSPLAARLDVGSELRTGFPYRLAHAEAVGELLAALIAGPRPKKGLITDLDDTCWRGLLGEAGVQGVAWDLAAGARIHALYQHLLTALAESGVLVGVVSKNDPELVERALQRPDMLLARDRLHPVVAGWGPKSDAVGRILRTWNVGADSVVFVDDTPMELAEVAAAHPGIDCVRFPADDAAAAWLLFERLRDMFGKTTISDEDRIRLASIRDRELPGGWDGGGAGAEAFLASAAAVITLDDRVDPDDARALELVNKTNQFNLNGRRYTDRQWRERLGRPDAFLLRASYQDRFGPLGTIAILAGRVEDGAVTVDDWVMSCRAFSRRIEHQCVQRLFQRFGTDAIRFDYAKTERNGPLQDFFAALPVSSLPGAGVLLRRPDFEAACPVLSHEIREVPPNG